MHDKRSSSARSVGFAKHGSTSVCERNEEHGSEIVGRGFKGIAAPVLAMIFVTSGCMVGPKYVPPTVPMAKAPDAYKELDPSWKPAAPADMELKGDWWTLFNEPVLNELEPEGSPCKPESESIGGTVPRSARADSDQPREPLPNNRDGPFHSG